jgi:hypothetical protein
MIRDTSHVGSVVEPKESTGWKLIDLCRFPLRNASFIAEARFQDHEFWKRALPGYCQQQVLSALRTDGDKDSLSVSKNRVHLRILASDFSTLAT